MKLAVLSDIHGNGAALRAVRDSLPDGCQILCCGDFVGYYPDVNEVCDWARTKDILAVRGNHEAMLLGELDYASDLEEHYRLEQVKADLSAENAAWLAALPQEQQLTFAGWNIRIRHASPWDETTYLYPDSPRLEEISVPENEILFIGHTHRPFIRQAGAGWLINVGSVGQPRDYDPRACVFLMDGETGTWSLERIAYDQAAYQQHLRDLGGYPEKSISILDRQK